MTTLSLEKRRKPTPYVVVVSENDIDRDVNGDMARFRNYGDAFAYLQTLRERLESRGDDVNVLA